MKAHARSVGRLVGSAIYWTVAAAWIGMTIAFALAS